MDIYKSSCKSNFISGFLVVILLSLLSLPALAANFPLKITQPQANLDTKNRFYKAYPNLEYNVRLAVIGGEYPFSFALTTAPTDMTIDARGEISWMSPTASATPYNVTAVVTDSQSTVTNVSWTITVTTDGFRFIDAVNGTPATLGGTGSNGNPWKSIKDMYEGDTYASKSARSYAGEFLYWRAGTYGMDAYTESTKPRTPFVGNNKPTVWLAYPGEAPVIDLAASYISIYGGGSNTYFDGIKFNVNGNSRGMGITIGGGSNNVTFRRNTLFGINNGLSGGNHSLIFIQNGGQGLNLSIQDNEMYNVTNSGYGVLGYSARDVLIENNTFHNIRTHPISPKSYTTRWDIRGNRFYNNPSNSIIVQYYSTVATPSGDIEISHNLVETGGGKVRINSEQTTYGLPVYIFRNTFMDEVEQNRATSTNGIFSWTENVIVNETTYPEQIRRRNIDAPLRVVVTNNLTGNSSDNIVDSQGYLTQGYNTFIGSRGHQLGNRISAPTALVITQ